MINTNFFKNNIYIVSDEKKFNAINYNIFFNSEIQNQLKIIIMHHVNSLIIMF